MDNTMSKSAIEMRRAYQREWYRKNRDNVRKRQAQYWERKAARAAGSEATIPELDTGGK